MAQNSTSCLSSSFYVNLASIPRVLASCCESFTNTRIISSHNASVFNEWWISVWKGFWLHQENRIIKTVCVSKMSQTLHSFLNDYTHEHGWGWTETFIISRRTHLDFTGWNEHVLKEFQLMTEINHSWEIGEFWTTYLSPRDIHCYTLFCVT